MTEASEGGHRTAGSHGIEQNLANEDKANRHGDLHVEEDAPDNTLPPGGSPHGAPVSVAIAGSSCGTRLMSDPPGGNGDGDEVKDNTIWYGNECPLVEEQLD